MLEGGTTSHGNISDTPCQMKCGFGAEVFKEVIATICFLHLHTSYHTLHNIIDA